MPRRSRDVIWREIDGSVVALEQHVLAGTSPAAFSVVFLIAAGTLSLALLALILLEEKPLSATMPGTQL